MKPFPKSEFFFKFYIFKPFTKFSDSWYSSTWIGKAFKLITVIAQILELIWRYLSRIQLVFKFPNWWHDKSVQILGQKPEHEFFYQISNFELPKITYLKFVNVCNYKVVRLCEFSKTHDTRLSIQEKTRKINTLRSL